MSKNKILLVEDNPDIATLVCDLFQSLDFQVDLAMGGQQALAKMEHYPDLLLLDRTLPDMDGLEVCRLVREDKRFRGIPIVILSGRSATEDKIEGLYIGADDYITKPFSPEELAARVKVALRRLHFTEQLKEEQELLVSELRSLIQGEAILPFFQPIFDLRTMQPSGAEVLSRPQLSGPLSNPEFLFKLALSCGMYFELEMLCWRKAFAAWQDQRGTGKLFLNCSPYLLECGQFDPAALQRCGGAPERIVLELTERSAIKDYGVIYDKLDQFKALQMGVAVDDVGCGFASLNTVARVRPHYLKIDLALISSIHLDLLKQDIVEAIVTFSRKHQIQTIAEGIERQEELDTAKALGVDAGQGYLLARPSPEL